VNAIGLGFLLTFDEQVKGLLPVHEQKPPGTNNIPAVLIHIMLRALHHILDTVRVGFMISHLQLGNFRKSDPARLAEVHVFKPCIIPKIAFHTIPKVVDRTKGFSKLV
jgi:hypothetical protein